MQKLNQQKNKKTNKPINKKNKRAGQIYGKNKVEKNYPIIIPDGFYSVADLYRRGWSQTDIDNQLNVPDRQVSGMPIYEADRVYSVENTVGFRESHKKPDDTVVDIVERMNKMGEMRFFGILADGREIGGMYHTGFKSARKFKNYYYFMFRYPE